MFVVEVLVVIQYSVLVVRWMCGVKLKDRVSNKELRERLGIVDDAMVRGRWRKMIRMVDEQEGC